MSYSNKEIKLIQQVLGCDYDFNIIELIGDDFELLKSLISISNNVAYNILIESCRSGKLDFVKYMISIGFDSVIRNKTVFIFEAIQSDNIELIKLLIEYEADINSYYMFHNNTLHVASSQNKIDVVRLLLESRVNINNHNVFGNTALHIASCNSNLAIAKLLLDNGADVNARNQDDLTPLHCACYANNVEIVKLLLDNGADYNLVDEDGNTCIHVACIGGNLELLKLLLETMKVNLDINIQNKEGETPLMIAIKSDIKNDDIIKYIILS